MGVVGLGEEMPSTVTLSAARLLAWAMILLGVSALASGQGKPHALFCVQCWSICAAKAAAFCGMVTDCVLELAR